MKTHKINGLFGKNETNTTTVMDASEIGLKPGQWPDEIRSGNHILMRHLEDISNGELLGIIYRDERQNVELHLLND